MKVYKPVFDGKWKIEVLESDLLVPVSNSTVCYYKRTLVSMVVCII